MRVRCPTCHDTTELDESAELSDIACPCCGSRFNLLGEETLPHVSSRGKTISHFELVEQLGQGTFGAVWLARDRQLERDVAVKIPRKGQLDAEETEQFLREARAAAQLKHPHIVAVHEVGRIAGQIYIVSEYVEGLTLADWLVGQQPTSRLATELCVALAEAVHHAHQSGVIHRDLKPTNIILDRDNEPHIMDFGLARREANEVTLTIEGKVLGTPAYMSPEQAQGDSHQADRRSDVYSLGVIFFELLTGERPFRGNPRMLLLQVMHDEPPRPRRLNNSIPRDAETICLKCLRKDPRGRYQTAGELADDLRRYLEGREILARPLNRVERSWRLMRRNPIVAGLIAAVSLLLATATGLAFWNLQSRAASARRDATELRERVARQETAARKVGAAVDETVKLRSRAEARPEDDALWDLALESARRADQLVGPELADSELPGRVADLLGGLERDAAAAHRQSERRQREQKLAQELDEVRLSMAGSDEQGMFDRNGAADRFASALRRHGFDFQKLPEAELVKLIQETTPEIRGTLASALDQWLYAGWLGTGEDALRRWDQEVSGLFRGINWGASVMGSYARQAPLWNKLLSVANQVDPDPVRVRLRKAASRFEMASFRDLAARPDVEELPPETLRLAAAIVMFLGDSEKAIALLERGVVRRPGDFWLHHDLGDKLRMAGRWEDALAHYAAAAALRPDATLAQCKYALALSDARGRTAEAIAVLRRAIELAPTSALAFNNLGRILLDAKDYPAATESLREAIRLAPTMVTARWNLGRSLYFQSDWEGAADSFSRVAAMRPGEIESYGLWGLAQLRLGQIEAGLEHCLHAARLDESGRTALRLAKDQAFAHAPAAAWTLLQEAIRQQVADKSLSSACLDMGGRLRQAGQDDQALEAFRAAARVSASDGVACLELAREIARQNVVTQSFSLTADLPAEKRLISLLSVAQLLCLAENRDEYATFCQQAWKEMASSPDHSRQHVLARILSLAPKSGVEPAEAVRLAESSARQADSAIYQHVLAMAYFRAERLDDARRAVERSQQLDSAWRPPLNALLWALLAGRQGMADAARNWLAESRHNESDYEAQDRLEVQFRRREVEQILAAVAPASQPSP